MRKNYYNKRLVVIKNYYFLLFYDKNTLLNIGVDKYTRVRVMSLGFLDC